MNAGRLRYRLTLLEPVSERTAYGSERITYVSRGDVWAERARYSGSGTVEASERFADYSADWIVRDTVPAGEEWRVRDSRGTTYTVRAVDVNLPRGMKTLKCERTNE